jgi:DNA-binding NarL/FixJ family response regulator
MIKVVVADDHAMVREGLRALISSMDGYELVGTASTGADAVRESVLLKPDLLVLDIGFPYLSGIQVVRRLAKAAPSVKILMLTMYDDDESILGAVRTGALGYVLKGADADDLLRAIAAVAAGEAIFGPGLARRALHALSTPREPAFAELSRRERDVVELIASGLSNQAIAAKLGLSSNTISNHISSIFSKLQVASRAEAIVRARSAGLGSQTGPPQFTN